MIYRCVISFQKNAWFNIKNTILRIHIVSLISFEWKVFYDYQSSIREWKRRERKGLCRVCGDESSLFASLKRISGHGEVERDEEKKSIRIPRSCIFQAFPFISVYPEKRAPEDCEPPAKAQVAASFERIFGSRLPVAVVKYELGTNCKVAEETPFDPAYTPRVSLTQRQSCIHTLETRLRAHTTAHCSNDRLLNTNTVFPFYECWVRAKKREGDAKLNIIFAAQFRRENKNW